MVELARNVNNDPLPLLLTPFREVFFFPQYNLSKPGRRPAHRAFAQSALWPVRAWTATQLTVL
jgi:hypothetical protein